MRNTEKGKTFLIEKRQKRLAISCITNALFRAAREEVERKRKKKKKKGEGSNPYHEETTVTESP